MTKPINPNQILIKDDADKSAWEQLTELLQTEYTMSIKDICKILKCGRSWVYRYIQPHLKFVKISNGYFSQNQFGPNYVELLKLNGLADDKSMLRFSRSQFEKLINDHICESTRQTIRTPIEWLVEPSKMDYFKSKYIAFNDLKSMFSERKINFFQFNDLLEKMNILRNDCLTKDGLLMLKKVNCNKRSNVSAVNFEINKIDINRLIAPHSLLDYGDAPETVYRKIFNEGLIKLVLCIPDINGDFSKKIYYFRANDEYLKDALEKSIEPVLIPYADYLKHFKPSN